MNQTTQKFGKPPPKHLLVLTVHFLYTLLMLYLIAPPFIERHGRKSPALIATIGLFSICLTEALFAFSLHPVHAFRGFLQAIVPDVKK